MAPPIPFQPHFTPSQLAGLKSKLKAGELPPPTFESVTSDKNRKYGVGDEWMKKAKKYWEEEFDWSKQEEKLNPFPHYISPISHPDLASPLKIHFMHTRSPHPNARPLLLVHGWPGSILEFLSIMDLLKDDFHLVVPSLPGYAFSEKPPVDRDFGLDQTADLFDSLMKELGYEEYAVQGGDLGMFIARCLSRRHPSSCRFVHFNMMTGVPPPTHFHSHIPTLSRYPPASYLAKLVHFALKPFLPDLSTYNLTGEELVGVARGDKFAKEGKGYSYMHRTRGSTIAHTVGANPVALLAWIGDKFLAWTDEDPSLEEICTSLTLWYLTDTFATSTWPYRHLYEGSPLDPKNFIATPTAYSHFAKEISPVPRAWAARTCNLKFYRYHSKGGHFAALEKPDALAKDVKEFLGEYWPRERASKL